MSCWRSQRHYSLGDKTGLSKYLHGLGIDVLQKANAIFTFDRTIKLQMARIQAAQNTKAAIEELDERSSFAAASSTCACLRQLRGCLTIFKMFEHKVRTYAVGFW